MAHLTVGLDIGSRSIKGVRLARGLRGTWLTDYFVHPVPDDPARSLVERQEEALRALKAEGRLKGERWVVGIPASEISLREMELPFSDPGKINEVAAYEIESQIPFDLQDVVVQAVLLEREASSGKARVLTGALSRERLTERLRLLERVGIDPQEVELDGLALARLFRGAEPHPPSPLWLIEMGASQTQILGIHQGRLIGLRGLAMGGDWLTQAMARGLSLSEEEAEKMKREVDLNDPHDVRASLLQDALEPWINELEKTLRLVTEPFDEESKTPPPRLLLMGGGGRLRGLSEVLADRLAGTVGVRLEVVTPVHLLQKGPGSEIGGLRESLVSGQGGPSPIALALALRAEEGWVLGFRRGEFAFGKAVAERRAQWIALGVTLLLLLGFWMGNLYVRYQVKASRYQELKRDLRSQFEEAFPTVRPVVQEISQARSAIDALKRTEGFLGVGEPAPLHVLEGITHAVPKGIAIEVHDLLIDKGTVRMEAQTDSFESIDRIKAGLASVSGFREVTVSDAKVGADPEKVKFRIQFKALTPVGEERGR